MKISNYKSEEVFMSAQLFFSSLLLSSLLFTAPSLNAQSITTESVEYKHSGTALEGFWAYPSSKDLRKRPLILIVHDWMGPSEYTQMRAREMAEKGYIAFAVDIYGKGQRPKDYTEAGQFAGKFKGDLKLLRARAKAAYDFATKNPRVDTSKVVAIGYCFGGTTALEMARSGMNLAGVASFHGNLATKDIKDAKNIKGKVLVLHGAIDPYVSAEEMNTFEKEFNDAKVDYQLIKYSGAVHSFTQKSSGNDISKGAAYNEKADKRSMLAFLDFMNEISEQ